MSDVTAEHCSGLTVHVYRSSIDGQLVVDIDSEAMGDDGPDCSPDGSPRVRIMINAARVFDGGEPVPESEWLSAVCP